MCVCVCVKEMCYKALEVDSPALSFWPPFGGRNSLQNKYSEMFNFQFRKNMS